MRIAPADNSAQLQLKRLRVAVQIFKERKNAFLFLQSVPKTVYAEWVDKHDGRSYSHRTVEIKSGLLMWVFPSSSELVKISDPRADWASITVEWRGLCVNLVNMNFDAKKRDERMDDFVSARQSNLANLAKTMMAEFTILAGCTRLPSSRARAEAVYDFLHDELSGAGMPVLTYGYPVGKATHAAANKKTTCQSMIMSFEGSCVWDFHQEWLIGCAGHYYLRAVGAFEIDKIAELAKSLRQHGLH